MSHPTHLAVDHARGRSLAALVADTAGQDGLGLLQTPTAYLVARLTGGQLVTPVGPVGQADLSGVFEARLVLPATTTEVRWTAGHPPRHAVVSVTADSPDGALPLVDTWETTQLLWGTISALDDGWATLGEARTGPFQVPAPPDATTGDLLEMVAVSCLAFPAQHIPELAGNVRVVDEVLVGLRVAAREDQQ